jgi:hypothetical protein
VVDRPSWIKLKPVRRRLGGLDADIFNVVGRKVGAPSILKNVKQAKKPLRAHGFTCEQLRNQLLRVSLEVNAGLRQRPKRLELQAEIAKVFGVKPTAINAAVMTRCRSERDLYRSVSYSDSAGFTPEESAGVRARLAAARITFTCDDIEAVFRESPNDHRIATLAEKLSEKLGRTIQKRSVAQALNERCTHLLPVWKRQAWAKGKPSFSCEDLKAAFELYANDKHPRKSIASALGVTPHAIDIALYGRCKHLGLKYE